MITRLCNNCGLSSEHINISYMQGLVRGKELARTEHVQETLEHASLKAIVKAYVEASFVSAQGKLTKEGFDNSVETWKALVAAIK